MMDGDAIKAEAVHLIESNIDLSLALAEVTNNCPLFGSSPLYGPQAWLCVLA